MPAVTEAYLALSTLRAALRKKHEVELAMLAKGLDFDQYREHVGRGKALAEVLDLVQAQIVSNNRGDDIDGENSPSP
jgi:hypothetical protein